MNHSWAFETHGCRGITVVLLLTGEAADGEVLNCV